MLVRAPLTSPLLLSLFVYGLVYGKRRHVDGPTIICSEVFVCVNRLIGSSPRDPGPPSKVRVTLYETLECIY